MHNSGKSLYRPAAYFMLTYALTWLPWIVAALLSRDAANRPLALACAFLGLLGPAVAAVSLVRGKPQLVADCRTRLLALSGKAAFLALSIPLLLVAVLLLATLFSVWLGYSPTQFHVSANFVGMLPLAVLAPACEELGWRCYGVDSLKSRYPLLTTSLLFSLLWGVWHIPLFFMHGTYQHGLVALGSLYVVNFFVSVIPAAVLSNWFYYQSGRSIPVAIWFHTVLVATAELLQTQPLTKCFVTLVLLLVCCALVMRDSGFFMNTSEKSA